MNKRTLSLGLRILFYLSLIFLTIYLYRKGLLVIPDLRSPTLYIVSVIIILIGFFVDAKAWQLIVHTKISNIAYKDALISTGKYIFTKYVPGKIWVIIGRAGYLREKYKQRFLDLTSLSLYYQIISIFSAILIGLIILYLVDFYWFLGVCVGIFASVLLIYFFSKSFFSVISRFLSVIFRREIELPIISFKITIKLVALSLGNWLTWSLAFYLFFLSSHDMSIIDVRVGFLFPLASAIGFLIIMIPGGLGFREGVLTIGLIAFGVSTQEATSIAVLSRLWTLFGELVFFLTSILLQIRE